MQAISGMLMPDDVTLEISSTGKFQIKDLGATAAKVSAIVGAPVSKSANTVYQADTDGIATFIGDVDNGDDFIIHTDASNPPTTARQRIQTGSGTTAFTGSMCCLVKKGDYYKFTVASGTLTSGTMFFTPIGS